MQYEISMWFIFYFTFLPAVVSSILVAVSNGMDAKGAVLPILIGYALIIAIRFIMALVGLFGKIRTCCENIKTRREENARADAELERRRIAGDGVVRFIFTTIVLPYD